MIAIIGILVALLLPAVQAAREAARRMQCVNNVKQVSLALHNYHAARDRFPHGVYNLIDDYPNGTPAPYNGQNERRCWMHDILPYLEEQTLYDEIDSYVRRNPNGVGNAGPSFMSAPNRWTAIPSLMCSSDPRFYKAKSEGVHGPLPAS